jgi:alpha-L-arabinofuranosidase
LAGCAPEAALPSLDVSATRSSRTGSWVLAVVNRNSDEEVEANVLVDAPEAGKAMDLTITEMLADNWRAYNDFGDDGNVKVACHDSQHPSGAFTWSFRPCSITVIEGRAPSCQEAPHG